MSLFLKFATMARLRLIGVALLLGLTGSCAQLPPSKSTLSGKRLLVTLRFRSPINPNYHYFFLINNVGDQNAPGPVPVLTAPYGNGFATGSGGGQAGFTDFVRFDNLQPQGYGLYHVIGDPNRSNFVFEGQPVTFVAPDPTDPRTANQLQFELDLSQIVLDSNGQPLTNAQQTTQLATAIRFLQINIIATDIIPRDVTTPVAKQIDSLGDTRSLLGVTSFLILDASQIGRIYNNTSFIGQSIAEPDTLDVYNGNDPTLDLVDWSVEVRQVK